VLVLVTTANRDYAGARCRAPRHPPAGSGRAITGLPAVTRLAPRSFVLDLPKQVSTHFREGMIKVAACGVGRGEPVALARLEG